MKSLLEKMQQDLVIQNYNPRTIELDKWHVKAFLSHQAKAAELITADDIRDYLFHVKTNKHYAGLPEQVITRKDDSREIFFHFGKPQHMLRYLGRYTHRVAISNMRGVQIKAICDIVEEKVRRMQSWVIDAGFPEPTGYWCGELDFKRMCQQEELDLVFTATPWRWHVPVFLAAMENGKHAATEVPAAVTVDECWQLVEAAEKYNKHCTSPS